MSKISPTAIFLLGLHYIVSAVFFLDFLQKKRKLEDEISKLKRDLASRQTSQLPTNSPECRAEILDRIEQEKRNSAKIIQDLTLKLVATEETSKSQSIHIKNLTNTNSQFSETINSLRGQISNLESLLASSSGDVEKKYIEIINEKDSTISKQKLEHEKLKGDYNELNTLFALSQETNKEKNLLILTEQETNKHYIKEIEELKERLKSAASENVIRSGIAKNRTEEIKLLRTFAINNNLTYITNLDLENFEESLAKGNTNRIEILKLLKKFVLPLNSFTFVFDREDLVLNDYTAEEFLSYIIMVLKELERKNKIKLL